MGGFRSYRILRRVAECPEVAGLDDASADAEVMEQRRYILRRIVDPFSCTYVRIETDRRVLIGVKSNDRFELLD